MPSFFKSFARLFLRQVSVIYVAFEEKERKAKEKKKQKKRKKNEDPWRYPTARNFLSLGLSPKLAPRKALNDGPGPENENALTSPQTLYGPKNVMDCVFYRVAPVRHQHPDVNDIGAPSTIAPAPNGTV